LSKSNRLEIINKEPDRVYRLINLDPTRIWRFEQAGWRVEDLEKHLAGSQRASIPTVIDNAIMVGGGQKQVLMSIEREYFDEDQAALKERQDELERSLKPRNSDGMYGGELTITNK
jgi:hypothetical protein